MAQMTLQKLIDAKAELTAEQKESLFCLFVGRSRAEARDKLRRRMDTPLSLWPNYGIFGRVHLESDGQFSYCAGQDYPAEVAHVRQLIIKG